MAPKTIDRTFNPAINKNDLMSFYKNANVITLNPNEFPIQGQRYKTYADIMAYLGTLPPAQQPSPTNPYLVKFNGTITEDIAVYENVILCGDSPSTSILAGSVQFMNEGSAFSNMIYNAALSDLVIDNTIGSVKYSISQCTVIDVTEIGTGAQGNYSNSNIFGGNTFNHAKANFTNCYINPLSEDITLGEGYLTNCTLDVGSSNALSIGNNSFYACSILQPASLTLIAGTNFRFRNCNIDFGQLYIPATCNVKMFACFVINTIKVDGILTTFGCTLEGGGYPCVPVDLSGGGSWDNIGDAFDTTGTTLTETDVQHAIQEVYGMIVPPIIDIDYITFSHYIATSALISGAKYRITDYQTIHQIPGTMDINYAGVESLIVTAIDVNKISKHAVSEAHPEDLIEYDYSLSIAEDGSTPRPGLIVYRKDTVNDVEAYYDWRTYIFRRYEIDQAASNPSGAHYVWSAVPTPSFASFSGIPMGMTLPVTIQADVAGLVGNILLVVDSGDSLNTAIANWNAANPSNTITLISGDGTQVGSAVINLMGGLDGVYVRGDVAISPVNHNLYINLFGNNTGEPSVTKQDWSQIVILGSNNAFVPGIQILNKLIVLNTSAYNNYPTFNGTVKNAHIGVGSIDNVFLGNCKNINIENDCTENTFGTLNDGIILHNNCTKNIFGGWVNFAELGAYSWHNLIGDTTLYSEMKENGSYNVIVGGSSGNRLDYSCSNNIIDLACNNTAFGSNCIFSTVGAAIDFTRLGNSCKFINIGDGLANPICVSINIGNNCEYINIPAGSYNVHIPYRVENLDLSPLSGVYNVRFEVGGIHTDFIFPPTGLYNFAGVSFAAATHMSLPYSKVVFTTSAVPWISGNSYNIGNRVIDTVNVYEIYECINPTSGTTEPSADATNWVYYGTTARLKYTDELDNTVITDVNA